MRKMRPGNLKHMLRSDNLEAAGSWDLSPGKSDWCSICSQKLLPPGSEQGALPSGSLMIIQSFCKFHTDDNVPPNPVLRYLNSTEHKPLRSFLRLPWSWTALLKFMLIINGILMCKINTHWFILLNKSIYPIKQDDLVHMCLKALESSRVIH